MEPQVREHVRGIAATLRFPDNTMDYPRRCWAENDCGIKGSSMPLTSETNGTNISMRTATGRGPFGGGAEIPSMTEH